MTSTKDDGKPRNMDEIMAAIQKVLAEHDVSQARVVLELFDEADGAGQRQPQQSTEGAVTTAILRHATPKPATSEGLILPIDRHTDAPMQSPEPQAPPPRPQSSSDHCAHTMAADGTRASPCPPPSPAAGHRLGAVATQASEASAPPPPAPRTAIEDREVEDPRHTDPLERTARPSTPEQMGSDGGAAADSAPLSASATTLSPASELLPQDLLQELHQQQSRAERLSVLKSFVGKSALLDDKKQREALKQQSPPSSSTNAFLSHYRSARSASARAGTAAPDRPPSESVSPTVPSGRTSAVRLSLPTDSPTPLPTLAGSNTTRDRRSPHIPGKNPIFGILNKDSSLAESGGGSVSSSSRRQNSVSVKEEPPVAKSPLYRPVLGEAAAKHQPDSILRGTGSRPSITESSDTTRTTAGAPAVLPAANAARAGSPPTAPGEAHDSDAALPLLNSKTFTATSRNNAARAAHMAVGLSTTSDGGGAVAGGSLKDMLREQQRMEQQSQAALREHAAAMEKARRSLQDGEDGERGKPHPDAVSTPPPEQTLAPSLRSGPAPPASERPVPDSPRGTPSCGAAAPANPAPPAPKAKSPVATAVTPPRADALLPRTSRTSSRRSIGSAANSSGIGRGIHVVRFTLPSEKTAKDSVVTQLSRSPAGPQHLSTKDKYAAMLAGQNQVIHENEGKSQKYQKLVERVVEFNEGLLLAGGAANSATPPE